jgi:hypothetical protein
MFVTVLTETRIGRKCIYRGSQLYTMEGGQCVVRSKVTDMRSECSSVYVKARGRAQYVQMLPICGQNVGLYRQTSIYVVNSCNWCTVYIETAYIEVKNQWEIL